jgi:Zn-dependent metalloprotease
VQLEIAAFDAPLLVYYHAEDDNRWHLAYFFRAVPAAPKEFLDEARDRRSVGHGLGSSPRERYPKLDYIVDAHDGTILNYYSATPMATMPSKCEGPDEDGAQRKFFAVKVPATQEYELEDPVRSLKTFDLGGQVLDNTTPVPATPVRHNQHVWAAQHAAAISAHANAARVHHFYSSVLYRDSVDDKGMELLSIINCTTNDPNDPPPEWHNAVWWRNAMWYGQAYDAASLRSFSRYLDVIAHELTHGVTERTAGLIYKGQSGALNESFSDILGVIIANWGEIGGAEPASVANWVWEIGAGLGGNGLPLRDLSDPKRTNDPDQMNDYLNTSKDNGGVHTNSNIHNKAAYNVLTSKTETGDFLFTPREAATLYYLTLRRLSSTATFHDALENLVTVTETYYPDAAERDVRVTAVRDAYQRVGIV